MALPTPSLGDQQVKHLEFIQSVVSRLANNGFLVKGWTVTVAGVFLGLAVTNELAWLAAVGVVPTLAFWSIDAYFLKSERLFRLLYDEVRTQPDQVEAFYMAATTTAYAEKRESQGVSVPTWSEVLVSRPLVWLYVALILVQAFVALAIC